MQVVKAYPQGTFSWIDLATTDVVAARAFYGDLFGWSPHDIPMPQGGIYSMMQIEGYDVAAISQMGPEQAAGGIPPAWTSYITVDDVDATTTLAASAGANVVMAPFDVMEEGRMALLADPGGAIFALWQPQKHIGAQLCNQPNSLVWNELATNDVDIANTFYGKVFGWTASVDESGTMPYHMFKNGERYAAGMLAMTEEWGGAPSHWMIYFLVEDVDATAAKALELGGGTPVPPRDMGASGRFAVLSDPQGAYFTVTVMGTIDSSTWLLKKYAGAARVAINCRNPPCGGFCDFQVSCFLVSELHNSQ